MRLEREEDHSISEAAALQGRDAFCGCAMVDLDALSLAEPPDFEIEAMVDGDVDNDDDDDDDSDDTKVENLVRSAAALGGRGAAAEKERGGHDA